LKIIKKKELCINYLRCENYARRNFNTCSECGRKVNQIRKSTNRQNETKKRNQVEEAEEKVIAAKRACIVNRAFDNRLNQLAFDLANIEREMQQPIIQVPLPIPPREQSIPQERNTPNIVNHSPQTQSFQSRTPITPIKAPQTQYIDTLQSFNNLQVSSETQRTSNDEEKCSICADILEQEGVQIGITDCEHEFHILCMKNFHDSCKKYNKEISCPNCRNKIQTFSPVHSTNESFGEGQHLKPTDASKPSIREERAFGEQMAV